MRQQKKHAGQALLTRVEQLVHQIGLDLRVRDNRNPMNSFEKPG
jgi:hypothetical protein